MLVLSDWRLEGGSGYIFYSYITALLNKRDDFVMNAGNAQTFNHLITIIIGDQIHNVNIIYIHNNTHKMLNCY